MKEVGIRTLGFRVQDLGCRVWGAEFRRVENVECLVHAKSIMASKIVVHLAIPLLI